MHSIQRYDLYRKIPKDLTQPTVTGAFISIACVVIISCLVVAEFLSYLTPEITTEMYVRDPKTNEERIPVRISIHFPKAPCKFLGLDIQDENGRHDIGVLENTDLIPLGHLSDGCLFQATFKVNKVPGNFHISTHGKENVPSTINLQHIVKYVVVGDNVPRAAVDIPGSFNPLYAQNHTDAPARTSHEYLLRIVPTEVIYADNFVIHPFQYTYAYRSFVPPNEATTFMPVIWFRYDLAPITVSYTERYKPLYHFLTMLFAIVGGTFTVASIIDSAVFTATNLLMKQELGKQS